MDWLICTEKFPAVQMAAGISSEKIFMLSKGWGYLFKANAAIQTADVICLNETAVVPTTGGFENLQTHIHVDPISKVQIWITCFVIYNLLVNIFLK